MKLLVLYLYKQGHIAALIEELKKQYEAAQMVSIDLEVYKKFEGAFTAAENCIAEAVFNEDLAETYKVLDQVRKLYENHGLTPTATDSGKYVMLRFLSELREALEVAVTESY